MTEIQTYNQAPMTLAPQGNWRQPPVVPTASMSQTVQRVMELETHAQALHYAFQIAEGLMNTAFVPKSFANDSASVAVAIYHGAELGLPPTAALKGIYVVHGVPALYARTMQALAIKAGIEFERVQANEQAVTVRAKRPGGNWQEFTWTIQRAEKAGYTTNAKYKTDPIGMLSAKAYADAVRNLAPDLLLGLPVAEEVELGDYDENKPAPITPSDASVSSSKKFQRKQVAAPAYTPEPAQSAPPATEEPTAPATTEEAVWVSKADQARISKLLDQLGVSDRAEKLSFVKSQVGDDTLRGVNGLTEAQAHELIAYLEAQPEISGAQ